MKTLIITGGYLTNSILERVLSENFEYIMVVDGGLLVIHEYMQDRNLGIQIHCIIGDFDTVDKELLGIYQNAGVKIEQFPPEKDYTDTHLALIKAIEYGASDIVIVGALGTRFDHTMANIGLLNLALDKNIKCRILDDNNIIQMIDTKIEVHAKDGNYISILPVTDSITGIYLEGFKYPLVNATIRQGESIGISNELLQDCGIIRISNGRALVIQAND